MKIGLAKMYFTAPLGVYEEERISGNDLEVSILMDVDVREKAYLHDNLEGTVDYTHCHKICASILEKPIHLLEYAAFAIAKATKEISPRIHIVHVKITKLHPPLAVQGAQTYVEVVL